MSDVVNPWESGRAGQCNAVIKGTRAFVAAVLGGYHNGGEGLRRPVDLYEINVSPGQVLTLTGETRTLVLGLPTSSPLLPGQRLAEAVAMPAAIEDARWRWRLRTGGAVSVDMSQLCVVALHFAADGFSNVQTMSVTRPDLVACSLRNMTDAWLTAREGERVRR